MTTPDLPADAPQNNFAYTAQSFEGQPMSGTIDASSRDDASRQLASLKLRIIRLDPVQRPPRAKPLSGDDFAAFNQQLAHLSAAGLPIEQGLRLIAEDLQHGGLAQSIRDVLAELERGVPLGEAFELHRKQFPPLYGAIVNAGVRTGDLPATLLNLGRHLELVARLRAALWRAVAYPLTVLAGLFVVLIFLGRFVLPQFEAMYHHWYMPLPTITQWVFTLAKLTPYIVILAIVLFIGVPIAWAALRATKLEAAAADFVVMIPLIGPVLRRNLIARWCDAMMLGVQAGLDLPTAVQLACEIVRSPALCRDCERIVAQLLSGKLIDQLEGRLSILPLTVLAIVQLSTERGDLAKSLQTLATMYQQQAEMRVASLQAVLTPALILAIAALIAFVVIGLFAPMISLFRIFS